MKRILNCLIFLVLFLPFITFAQISNTATQPLKETTETYTIDPMHSYVEWRVSHFDFSHPSGKWFVTGTLLLNETNPALSKISISVPVSQVVTGIPELDKHLKTPEFFDTEKYPTATFVSNKIEVTGVKSAKVEGTLTLHGTSKPISLNVKLNKIDISPITNKKTAGFSGDTLIKRSDFGMTNFLPGVSDEVHLHFEVEATLAS